MTRRKFLEMAGAAALVSTTLGASKPPLSIGLVADPQYADIEPWKARFYRKSINKLGEAIEHFNRQELKFCVNVGDLIDRNWDSFSTMLGSLKASRHRFHHVLGNHDYEVLDGYKALVRKQIGLKRRYYAVQAGAWCFVMLDTTEVSPYAFPKDSAANLAATAELKRMEALQLPQAKPWNGTVGPEQLEWFEATCRAASKKGQRVIVFAHHPVFPPNEHNEWNSVDLLGIVQRNRNVVAWLNGHNHAGNFGVLDGVPYVTFKGMVETENTNAFAVLHLHNDRMEIAGHGREPSRELVFRTA